MEFNPAEIVRPTLLLDRKRVIRNIERMANKARHSRVRLRPHFKTHQSAQIGEWFRDFGVDAITVSSVEMAEYFAHHGWTDVIIAFPLNWRQIERIDRLAQAITLHLLIDSVESAQFLAMRLHGHARIWIDIDTGHGRTGIVWEDQHLITQVANEIRKAPTLSFAGLLTHAGHTYHAGSAEEVRRIYQHTKDKLNHVRDALKAEFHSPIAISTGDTPGCSLMEDLSGVDEVRPGNFVFYDVTQWQLGACALDDIAIVAACPVVAKRKPRRELVIYGGAIHLSKDWALDKAGEKRFGYAVRLGRDGWEPAVDEGYVASLSQELGLVKATDQLFQTVQVGDLLAVLPVHTCLTVSAMKQYITLEGEAIDCMR